MLRLLDDTAEVSLVLVFIILVYIFRNTYFYTLHSVKLLTQRTYGQKVCLVPTIPSVAWEDAVLTN